MTGWRAIACAALAFLAFLPGARAHETRPAYLELKETEPGRFSVLWRTPVLSGMRLPVALKLPDGVRNLAEPGVRELTDSLLERRTKDGDATVRGEAVRLLELREKGTAK